MNDTYHAISFSGGKDSTAIVAGAFLVVGLGESEFASLTPALMEKYEKLFHSPEAFLNLNGHLTVIPMPEPQARKSTKERGEAR